jgi:hypothetical protein
MMKKLSVATFSLSNILMLSSSHCAAEVTPDQLEFRRQGTRRRIFDPSQDIPLAGLWPSNFPGMPTPSWTYGAMYLYHGYLNQDD